MSKQAALDCPLLQWWLINRILSVRFMVKLGLKETIPPFHQDTTQVKVWVVESNQEAILTIKTPPNEVPRDMLVDLLGNITGRLVLINKITPHVGEGAKVKKEW